MEVTELDPEIAGGLTAATAYLAALAFPESRPKRDRFMAAMGAWCVRLARYNDRRDNDSTFLKSQTPQQQKRGLHLGHTRLGHRLMAAEVACLALLASKNSLNDIIERRSHNASDFKHRIWAPSKPVLHLALALRGVLRAWPKERDVSTPLINLILNPGWVGQALIDAESWRRALGTNNLPTSLGRLDQASFIVLKAKTQCSD